MGKFLLAFNDGLAFHQFRLHGHHFAPIHDHREPTPNRTKVTSKQNSTSFCHGTSRRASLQQLIDFPAPTGPPTERKTSRTGNLSLWFHRLCALVWIARVLTNLSRASQVSFVGSINFEQNRPRSC